MKIRVLIAAFAAIAIVGFVTGPISPLAAQNSGPKNLFAQYYTPSGASQSHAGMYPAPHPVPRHVGHTYYTYQPLMPHEMLYTHSRNYYNFHSGPGDFYCHGCNGDGGGSGYNKTTVKWQNGNQHIGPLPFSRVPLQQLYYNWNKFRLNAGSGASIGGAGIGGGLGGGCLGGGCLGRFGSGAGGAGFGGGLGGLGGAGFGGGGFGGTGFGGGLGGVGFGVGGLNSGFGGSGFGGGFGGGIPFAGVRAGDAGLGSIAAENSWAQKAAAATASLVDGRIQR